MEQLQARNRNFETIAWGAIFIWWGITEMIPSLPKGIGALGFGLILLGLNAARARSGIPTSSFSIGLGILALVLGGLELAKVVLSLPFDLPVFAILLIALGVLLLYRVVMRTRSI